MKTINIITILFSTLLVACSSDDRNGSEINDNDTIIGTWKFTQLRSVDEGGSSETEIYSDCEQQGRTIFSANGAFAQIGYYPISGVCDVEYDNTGDFAIINNNILRITLEGQFDNGSIGDYLIIELTDNTLRIDADTDPNSIKQEIYTLERVE